MLGRVLKSLHVLYQLPIGPLQIPPKCKQQIFNNILFYTSPSFCGSGVWEQPSWGAGGLWLRVFHEFAAKCQLGSVSSEGLTGAGRCISKVPLMPGCLCWLLAGGLRASPCRPLQSAVCVLMTGRLDFPGGVLQESYNDAMTQSPKSVSVLSPDA